MISKSDVSKSKPKEYIITYTDGSEEKVTCTSISTSNMSVISFYCNNANPFKIVNVSFIKRIDLKGN